MSAGRRKGGETKKPGPGRPTLYRLADHPEVAYRLAAGGATSEEIARGLGIALSTLKAWQGEHEEFSAAIKAGKALTDDKVEKSLLQRALGVQVTETKIVRERPAIIAVMAPLDEGAGDAPEGDGELVVVRRERTTKELPPDTTAQIFWLKNRKPEEWRDKQQVEHGGTVRQEHGVGGMTDEELRAILAGRLRGEPDAPGTRRQVANLPHKGKGKPA